MRALTATAALLLITACNGPPARLVAGTSDTVTVSSLQPMRIPVRVLDASGHVLPDSGVRFAWTAGAPVPVTAAGDVSCAQTGDATLRATLGTLTTAVFLRCRPVDSLLLATPINLVVGDSARELPLVALGPDGHRQNLYAARVMVMDTTIASLEGLRIRPGRWGSTMVEVSVGGGTNAGASVHVFERASTLDQLSPKRPTAVPVRLAPGEMRRYPLKAGLWMVMMLPGPDEGRTPQLHVERAYCGPVTRPQWFHCLVTYEIEHDAAVVVSAPREAGSSSPLTGTVAIRGGGVWPPRFTRTLAGTVRTP